MKQEVKEIWEKYNSKCPFKQDKAIAEYLIQQLEGISIKRAKDIFETAIDLLSEQTIH